MIIWIFGWLGELYTNVVEYVRTYKGLVVTGSFFVGVGFLILLNIEDGIKDKYIDVSLGLSIIFAGVFIIFIKSDMYYFKWFLGILVAVFGMIANDKHK